MAKRHFPRGFTLIELMIVIVIMGVLTLLAYPSYRNYILKSRRSDALTALARDQAILERCYSQNFSYNESCSAMPSFPHNSTQNYYSISLSNLSGSNYTLTATAIGSQAADTTCSTLTVNDNNQRTATDSSGNIQNTCWAM